MSKIESQLQPHQRLVRYQYVTLPHDNLAKVVERFGCVPDWILEENRLKKPEDIRPGMRLTIPVAVPNLKSAWARGRRVHLITDKPYGGKAVRAGGLVHLSAIDRDDDREPDQIQFVNASWQDPRNKSVCTLEFTGMRTSKKSGAAYGGVGIQVHFHGKSGVGDADLPGTTALLALWGTASVWRDGKQIAKETPSEASITRSGGTSPHNRLDIVVPDDPNLTGGFLHLQARTVDLWISD